MDAHPDPLLRELDALSFEADAAVEDVLDLGEQLSGQDRAGVMLFASDIKRRLVQLRSGLPAYKPPSVTRYTGPPKPLGHAIQRGRRNG
jgi:hypothetical protein